MIPRPEDGVPRASSLPIPIRYGAALHPRVDDDPQEVTARLRGEVARLQAGRSARRS